MSQIACPAPRKISFRGGASKKGHIHYWPPHAVFASSVGIEMTPGSRIGDIVQCRCGDYALVKEICDDYGCGLINKPISARRAHLIMRKRGCPRT